MSAKKEGDKLGRLVTPIQVGKTYLNRGGVEIRIIRYSVEDAHGAQPFIDHEDNCYSAEGRWMPSTPGHANGTLYDLVEEVVGAPLFPVGLGPVAAAIVKATKTDTRAEQIQRLSPYFAGVALGREDVNGRPCPAVIHDGDSVLCLFTGSNGTAQAHLFADLLNYLVDALPAQAAIDAVADRGTAVTDAPKGSFERGFKADEFKIAATRCLLDHGDDLIHVIKAFRAIHDTDHPVLAEPQESDTQIFRTRHFGASLEAAPTTPYPEPKLIQANWNVDPSELNPNKRAVDVQQSLKKYEWFAYTGNPRDVIHKSGPSLEVKHGTVFGVRVDVKDDLGREELVFPALGTALSFNVSKNRIKHWKDRAIPLPDTQFVKDKRCLGFWNNERGQYPQFPMPKPTDMRPALRKAIVDALADVQKSPLLQVVGYRGYSSCRICDKDNLTMGSREYSIAPEYGKAPGWMWPEGLSHYVHEHGIVLPEAFLIEVLGIGRHRLAALGYYDLIELAPGVRVVQDGQIKTGFKELDAIMPQGFKRGEFIMHSAKPSSDGTYPDLGTANKYAQSDNGDQS